VLNQSKFTAIALALILGSLPVTHLGAEDAIETAGVATGVTAGNLLFWPLKSIAVSVGLITGALSFIVSGGNAELTKQIWHDTTQGPYLITPELAKQSVGQRPELLEKK